MRRMTHGPIALRAVAALAATVLIGAASPRAQAPAPTSTPVPAERLSRSWKRLTTPNYTIVSEGSEATLRDTATRVETFRDAVRMTFPAARLDAVVPTTLVVFDSDASFTPFKPLRNGRRDHDVAGYALFASDRNYLVLGRWGKSTTTDSIVFHEYTHYVMRRTFASVPFWYNEGVAEFFGAFAGTNWDSRPMVGRPIRYHLDTLRAEGLLPLRDMLVDVTAARWFRRLPERAYATSWLMTHYFLLDETRKQQLLALFGELGKGRDVDAAVVAAFGIDVAQLQTALDTYMRRAGLPALGVNTGVMASVDAPIERMSEADVAGVHGHLLVSLGDHKGAEPLIDRARQRAATHEGLRTVAAQLRLAQDRPDDALALFAGPALQPRSSDSFRVEAAALLELNRLDQAAERLSRAAAAGPPSPVVLFDVGRVAMARAAWPEATTAFARLRAIDGNPAWDLQRTYDAYRLGYGVYTVGAARAFIAKAGWADPSSTYAAFAGSLGLMRDKRVDEALSLVREIEMNTSPDEWPAPVTRFLQGRVSATALIDQAKDDHQRTEAHGYVGLKASAEGRRDEAIEHLTWVKDRGIEMVERRWAVAELARLAAAKQAQ